MKSVFVGLSGGVDSAVSAYLLKKEGYRVVGAFIKSWEPPFLSCTGARDRLEAMRVAAELGIPFVTYDLSDEYKRFVVDPFVAEYRAGGTPNPDVLCNRTIKFGAFWERARADGAELIATGHYAQIRAPFGARAGAVPAAAMFSVSENREAGSRAHASAGEHGTRDHYALKRGTEDGFMLGISPDGAKDQTYFLWQLTQDDLAHVLFPVGGLVKTEVRDIARTAALPNAGRKDSQGLCFLGHVDMKEFLLRFIERSPGDVVDLSGKQIGHHEGLPFYTIGERLPVAGPEKLYVIRKDREANALVAAPHSADEAPASRTFELERVNWIRGTPEPGVRYGVQVRYHGEMLDASVSARGGEAVIETSSPTLAAEGQSLVVYDAATKECMGGGIISVCR